MAEVDYNIVILKALAEIRWHQIVATKANTQTEDVYSDAFVYAIVHSVCPIFDEEIGFTEERAEILNMFPFRETYDVPADLVQEIADLLDEKWRNQEKITFYDIEGPYKLYGQHWKGKDPRVDLINMCRYFYLHKLFDKEFWEQFMSYAPSEASHVTSAWSRDELLM